MFLLAQTRSTTAGTNQAANAGKYKMQNIFDKFHYYMNGLQIPKA